jgi:hypothetical protein
MAGEGEGGMAETMRQKGHGILFSGGNWNVWLEGALKCIILEYI